jgi:hypothetical protein
LGEAAEFLCAELVAVREAGDEPEMAAAGRTGRACEADGGMRGGSPRLRVFAETGGVAPLNDDDAKTDADAGDEEEDEEDCEAAAIAATEART